MNKVKINFVYQSLYQFLLIVLPFVTAPYLSRTIGAEGVGLYSFSTAIASYFSLFCMLGINTYGNREIARVRDDREKLSQFFCNVFFVHACIGILTLIAYLLFIVFFVQENKLIFFLHAITLTASIIDINWLFFGIEDFKTTVIRNVLIKLLSVIAIFTLVTEYNDLWIYTLIIALGSLLSQIVLWSKIKPIIVYRKPQLHTFKDILSSLLIMFIPAVAVSIYKQMDKIMLGSMASFAETGYYEYAEKIINAPIGLISALGTVMLPKMSNLYANNQDRAATGYISTSMRFIMFVSIACTVGIIGIANDFIPLFLGDAFSPSIPVTYYLALAIIPVAWANVIRTQYLLPKGKDFAFVSSIVAGAFLNIIINALLIPSMGASGAAIGTLCTETLICIWQTITCIHDLEIKKYMTACIRFVPASLIMLVVIKFCERIAISQLSKVLIEILVGGSVYLLINCKYILELIGKAGR